MKHNFLKRAVSLLLTLVCVMGVLPLSAFAAEGLSSAPGSITQRSSDYMKIGGKSVRYRAASNVINNVGLPYVFNEQVEVPGYGSTRALCAYQKGTLGPGANGQKWNFKEEVNNASLNVLLTYIYSHTYGDYTDAGNAMGLEHWNEYWSNIWFLVAQAMSWYYEHGIILDVNSNREGFIEQAAEEFVAAMKLYHETYGQSSFITDWSKIGTHSIIDSADGGKTGNSAYDYVAAGVNTVLDHPEYFHTYHLWIYEWDKSQPWKLAGQSGVPMQRLLIAVPDEQQENTTVRLTVKKLEAGTNKPIPGVTFKVEGMDGDSSFSVTRETGTDGTFTLTAEADDLIAGQYKITEEATPEGYVAQTASQVVTVMPNGSANSVFVFYNEPNKTEGDGSIRKVDADNPTVGIPGAVIRITSVKLDDGGSFVSEYTTGDGGYIPKEDLDFSKLPTGSYIAEEITPPEGFILSSDVSKVKQPFVWDGEHDISLIFENSSKVKVQFKKLYEGNATGKIPDKHFNRLLAEYDTEQSALEQEAAELKEGITAQAEDGMRAQRFVSLVRRYTSFNELTTPMLNEFIEKVVVHEADKSTGDRRQKVDIYFNFIGCFVPPKPEVILTAEEEAKAQKALAARNREREQNKLRMRRVREAQRAAKEAGKVSSPAG